MHLTTTHLKIVGNCAGIIMWHSNRNDSSRVLLWECFRLFLLSRRDCTVFIWHEAITHRIINHKSQSKPVKNMRNIAPVKKVCICVHLCDKAVLLHSQTITASRHGWMNPLEGPGVKMNCWTDHPFLTLTVYVPKYKICTWRHFVLCIFETQKPTYWMLENHLDAGLCQLIHGKLIKTLFGNIDNVSYYQLQ